MVCPDLSISCNNPRPHGLFIRWGFSAHQIWTATCHFSLFHGIEMNVNAGHGVSEGCFCFWRLCFLSTFNAVGRIWLQVVLSEVLPKYDERTRNLLLDFMWSRCFVPFFIVHSLNLGLHDVCLMKLTTVQAHFVAVFTRLVNIKRSDNVDFSRWFCNKSACYSGSNWWVFNPTMKSNEIW